MKPLLALIMGGLVRNIDMKTEPLKSELSKMYINIFILDYKLSYQRYVLGFLFEIP